MELNARKGADIFVPPGAMLDLTARLQRHAADLSERPAVVVSCLDTRTRMLPFVIYDRFMFPSASRTVAATLHRAGFERTRAVFQLWNPNFRPSEVRFDGKLPELLCVSSMGINSAEAYRMIADAWKLGADRPLILAGGPKGIYEPYDYWPIATRHGNVGPDAVITGEAYVLLDLLNVLVDFRRKGETLRAAFERARHAGALDEVPGLVYLDPDASFEEPSLIDTGLQRLIQNFDELPDEVHGLSLLEPPHGRSGIGKTPLPAHKVRKYTPIVAVQLTQGCKFSCSYCPIPAVNQKTWRYRTPEGIVRQMRGIYDTYRIKMLFGSDDNFMNRRETAEETLEAIAASGTSDGRRLGDRIRWGTEATQFDTYKNRDLLPLMRKAGLYAIWFGIEDLTAELINKGQKPEVTTELFKLMHENRIAPMAMIMYHDGQPFATKDSLYGLSNQVRFLRDAGAVSLQCTVHSPAVGTKEWEPSFEKHGVLESAGPEKIDDRHYDGSHVIVKGQESHWKRHLKWLGAYWTFYNPANFVRALRSKNRSKLWKTRLGYQLIGLIAILYTTIKSIPWMLRLMFGKQRYQVQTPPAAPVPVHLAPKAFPRMQVTLPRKRTRKQMAKSA